MPSPHPHDLLWLDPTAILVGEGTGLVVPDWVDRNWPVVVRRARRANSAGLVPVGLRGPLRSQRCAALVWPDAIQKSVTPEVLQQNQRWLLWPALAGHRPVTMLVRLSEMLEHLGLTWGPTGSVGFALATGHAVLRPESDLDLLVRAPQALSRQQTALLQKVQQSQLHGPCRIDIQIDTGKGGFAFTEWARGSSKILLKTNAGPLLTDNPWA